MNRCWLAARVVAVKRKYDPSVDRREVQALAHVLSACTSNGMVIGRKDSAGGSTEAPSSASPSAGDALSLYDDNRNGRITCKEARRHGIAPVPRNHPAYPFMRDGDGDGIVCE